MPRMVNVNNHILRHMTSKYQNTGGKRRVPQASEFHTQDQEAEWLKINSNTDNEAMLLIS